MFWCHNSDEFKLQILEPSDISIFSSVLTSSRYRSLPVLISAGSVSLKNDYHNVKYYTLTLLRRIFSNYDWSKVNVATPPRITTNGEPGVR